MGEILIKAFRIIHSASEEVSRERAAPVTPPSVMAALKL